MASRNVKTYEAMDKMPSSTLKRHPKMDLNKNDLLRLLSYLEGELQARDISIAALKAEKAKQLLYQAKYGRFGLGDPFHAMQRDSDSHRDNSFDEAAVKAMYDNQLMQLENLIATQRKAQHRMREQLVAVEKRFHKVCAELEEEKQKHAMDTAQGDDVTYMLEKDRERLKQELDFEKSQSKKQEKELKKLTTSLEEERAMSTKHKQVALMLIKERKHYLEKLAVLQHHRTCIEHALKDDKTKLRTIVEELSQESQKSLAMEAAIEKRLSDFDIEREQLKGRLSREESRNADLQAQVRHLQQQLDGPAARGASPGHQLPAKPLGAPPSMFRNTPPSTPPEARRVPIVHVRSSPERDLSPNPQPKPSSIGTGLAAATISRAISDVNNGPLKPFSPRTFIPHDKPVPAEKPAESRVNVITSGGPPSVFSSPSGSTTVFTTPTGTRISLNVGASSQPPAPGLAGPRKPGAGRGQPPPLPPNKPQVYLPPATAAPAAGRRDNMSVVTTDPSPTPEMPPPQNLDTFGPEMEDLQKLLVSMATDIEFIRQKQKAYDFTSPAAGPSESDSSSVENLSSSSSSSSSIIAALPASESLDSLSSSSSSASSVVDARVSEADPALVRCVRDDDATTLEQLLTQNTDSLTQHGATLANMAAQLGNTDILRLLLDRGVSPAVTDNDKITPLHRASADGQLGCVSLLLSLGAPVSAEDNNAWTPLHWAATGGHSDVCGRLMGAGGRIDALNNSSWSPLHLAIHAGHHRCLEMLLTHSNHSADSSANHSPESSTNHSPVVSELAEDVVSLADKDGWTVVHLAAVRETKDCLEVLSRYCNLDLERTDNWNRDVQEVASTACKDFITGLASPLEKQCAVYVNVPESVSNKVVEAECHVGNVPVTVATSWAALEDALAAIFLGHLGTVELGVKSRRGANTGTDGAGNLPFSLGISLNSVKFYSIGVYHWSPGTPTDRSPWELLAAMNTSVVAIQLFGMDDASVDSLAYETLIPVPVLHNYLRLMEQYKNVIFYGPVGTGKSYMAKKLAQVIKSREPQRGATEIHTVTLTESFTQDDLVSLLLDKGVLLPVTTPAPSLLSIVILDDLHKVPVASVFCDVFPALEARGPGAVVRLRPGTAAPEGDYYLSPGCYILGTMDRARSVGLELAVQQRFRWVQFRCDQEPMRGLLARHLARRLVCVHDGRAAGPDLQRTVEWVVAVWQRLNEGLAKLGLADLSYGPVLFLPCPVEVAKPKAVLRWLALVWNHRVAPEVARAVVAGAGTSPTTTRAGGGGQQKVANTALYVLMQRAVVSGCPLQGQEKERYLSGFMGSNELDIKMRSDRKDSEGRTPPDTPTKTQSTPLSPRAPLRRPTPTNHSADEAPSPWQRGIELPAHATYQPTSGAGQNTYFALAGFPSAGSPAGPPSPRPPTRYGGVPVIVTQPSAPQGPPTPSFPAPTVVNPTKLQPLSSQTS